MPAPRDDTCDRLDHLPERHLAALRAVLAGFGDQDIAGLLGIPVEAVPATIRLAVAKFLTAVSAPRSRPVGDGERRGAASGAPQDQHPPADDRHRRSGFDRPDSSAPPGVPDEEHPLT